MNFWKRMIWMDMRMAMIGIEIKGLRYAYGPALQPFMVRTRECIPWVLHGGAPENFAHQNTYI
jgi:hypothetical protein